MLDKIIFVGGGEHARVLLDIIHLNAGKVFGYVDIEEKDFPADYLGEDSVLKQDFAPQDVVLVNGVGSVRRPRKRQAVFERFKAQGYRFFSVIHPRAVVAASVHLAEGVQVMANAVVNPGAVIADNVMINTSATVDHDCRVGAHSHIAPGVTLSGRVRIGEACLVGTGANIIQGVTVGDHVLIAAGETIRTDVASGETVIPIKRR